MKTQHILAVLAAVALAGSALAQETIAGRIGVGTWRTQAEFKDIRVTKGSRTIYASDFTKGTQGWRMLRGQWQVVDGALRQTGNDEDCRAMYGDPKWSDFSLSLKARKLGGGEGFLILFGAPDDAAKTWWNLGGWSNTQHAIELPGTVGERVPGRIETNRWYDIKVELKGNNVTAWLDGKPVQTAARIPRTHVVVFDVTRPGMKMPLTHWGLDTAWPDPTHIWRGVRYMGKDNVDVIRVSFPINEPLVNGELPESKKSHFTDRLEMAKLAGDKPFSMLPDTEAGVHPWYKNGRDVIPERWVQLMAASQRLYGKKLESVEAFNEADYGWGQGSAQNLNDILGALQNSPDFAGVQLGGPSTLSADASRTWYDVIRNRIQRATTHSLGGSFLSYINFYKQAAVDGKILDNPEAHNLAEVISGAEYGLQSATWWGTAELARGEFVKATNGERLSYAEDLARWNAAAVYRTSGGKVQAFLGASERMGDTSVYRFVSAGHPVYYDGDGPRLEYTVSIRKDTERVINITWGPDVPPKIGGRYLVVNRATGKVLGVDGAAILQMDQTGAGNQVWDIAPYEAPLGDQSYFTIRLASGGTALDTANRGREEGGRLQLRGDGKSDTQQWYFDYAGDNCFVIRSRWSTMCLQPDVDGRSADVVQASPSDSIKQRWRLIPAGELGNRRVGFTPPKAPVGLKASASRYGITVRWTPVRGIDVNGYNVYRAVSPKGPWDTIARTVQGSRFIDSGAYRLRTNYYVVKAVDRSLNRSASSAVVVVKP